MPMLFGCAACAMRCLGRLSGDFTALPLFISHTLETLLLIKTCGTHHAGVRQFLQSIWYLVFEIPNTEQTTVSEVVFKYQNEHRYLVFYLNTLL